MKYDNITFRYNIINVSSLQAFTNVKGGFNKECKDVYFLRFLGVDNKYVSEVEKMDNTLTTRMNEGYGKYNRITELPKLRLMEDIEFYSACYNEWLQSDKKYVALKHTENNRELMCVIGNACEKAVKLLQRESNVTNSSIEKNFVVKILFWLDSIANKFMISWNPTVSMKFVVENINKKQEYLFCYFLTMLGIDVTLLQYKSDIDTSCENMGLSAKLKIGTFGDVDMPKYNCVHSVEQPRLSAVSIRRPERDRKTRTIGTSHIGTSYIGTNPTRTSIPQNTRTLEMSFEELARLASSVVMIAIHDRKGQMVGTGSGIMIGQNGYILTNNHVAKGGVFYSVRIEEDDRIYKTDEVVKCNDVLDLALIRIDKKLKPLPFYKGGSPLVRGQKVVAIGSPLGLFNSVSDGIIAGFREIHNVNMIQFTAPISHGSSGGAVLNMYGEVIGISTAGMDDGQNINLAVGYEYINNFIRGFV